MPKIVCTELIEGALRAESIEDIHALCSEFCVLYGFDYFLYGAQLPTSLVKPELVIISGFPHEWWARYNANGYIKVDPVVAHTMTKITPLIWDGEPGPKADTPPGVHEFMCDAHDFGLRSGATFPVHGCQGESALLSFVSNESKAATEPRIVEALPMGQLMAGYVHEAVRRVFDGKDVALGRVALTRREKECLLWAAEGKTTWEAAKILGISERTVTFHLQNAATKLNVSNRPQAVARAVSQQLIGPLLG